eukprot:COSAG02_NODE_3524_length_6615_cov_6.371393_11_plen_218_part_00
MLPNCALRRRTARVLPDPARYAPSPAGVSPFMAARCAPLLHPTAAGFATEAQKAHAARIAASRAKWPHVDSGWGPTVSVLGRVTAGLLVFGGAGVAAYRVDRNNQKRTGTYQQPEVLALERLAPEVLAALVGWGILGMGLTGVYLATKMAGRVGQRLVDGPTVLQRYMGSLTDASGAPNQTSFGRTVLGVASGLGAVSAAWLIDGRADEVKSDQRGA